MTTRTVFMGSPAFALSTLRLLAGTGQASTHPFAIVGVVTQPDRPAGRGRTLTPPPIKLLAQELGLPVIQPNRLREPAAMEQLRLWAPELIVVAAFGQILKPEVLDLPRHGCINVHASLLPRWRGAAPIQAAILAGDTETGITILRMDPGIDTGPILSQRYLPIEADDTAGTLSEKLAKLGAQLLIETLPGYLRGEIVSQPQESAQRSTFNVQPTYAPMIKKEQGLLDFATPAADLTRRVRAFNPWPGAFTLWEGQILKIHRAHAADLPGLTPGARTIHEGLPAYGTGQGLLVLDEVQPAGKKSMPGKVFLQGARDWAS